MKRMQVPQMLLIHGPKVLWEQAIHGYYLLKEVVGLPGSGGRGKEVDLLGTKMF